MNVPGARQFLFLADVHTRFGDFLPGDDLSGGTVFKAGNLENERVVVSMHWVVTLGAVLVAWVLQGNGFGFHLTQLVKGFGRKTVAWARAGHDTSARQRGGVGPAKC